MNQGTLQVEVAPVLTSTEFEQAFQDLTERLSAQGIDLAVELGIDDTSLLEVFRILAETVNAMNAMEVASRRNEGSIRDITGSAAEAARRQEEDEQREKSREQKMRTAMALGVQYGTAGLQKISSSSLGFLEDIFQYMKQSSPLLQAIESMFNLAIQLFFMPIGNELAEVVLPAVIGLVDSVVEFTEGMEGMTLPEMMNHMLEHGVVLFADFFENLADSLDEANSMSGESNSLLGVLADLLHTVADLIENGTITTLIELVIGTAELILSNIAEFIAIYVALQTMQITATIASSFGVLGGVAGLAATLEIGTIAGLATYAGASALGFSEGGEVPATPGGVPVIVAEGGENEYIYPESKLPLLVAQAESLMDPESRGRMRSENVQVVNNFYGYNEDEMVNRINDTVNTAVSRGRTSGAF